MLSRGRSIINAETIPVEQIEEDLFKVLSPFLVELDDLGVDVEYEEFADAMDRLLPRLNPQEKRVLLKKR